MAFNYSPKIVTDGLVLALDAANTKSYPGSGTKWNDLSRGGNNGTLINGPTFNSVNGGSIVFDGVDDRIEINDNNSIDIVDNLTIECWFYTIDYTNSYSVNFIRKMSTISDANFNFYFAGTYTPKKIRVLATRNGVWGLVSPTSVDLNLNQWYHVVWSYSNGGLLYINGISQGTKTGGGLLSINSDQIILGNGLNGGISNFKMYNKALSPTEIQQNYNATKTRYGL
jgi:hypothetical protein